MLKSLENVLNYRGNTYQMVNLMIKRAKELSLKVKEGEELDYDNKLVPNVLDDFFLSSESENNNEQS